MRFGDSSDYHRHLGTNEVVGEFSVPGNCEDTMVVVTKKEPQTKEPTKDFFPEGGLKMMKGGSFFV